jgi:hypothetical protein
VASAREHASHVGMLYLLFNNDETDLKKLMWQQ